MDSVATAQDVPSNKRTKKVYGVFFGSKWALTTRLSQLRTWMKDHEGDGQTYLLRVMNWQTFKSGTWSYGWDAPTFFAISEPFAL